MGFWKAVGAQALRELDPKGAEERDPAQTTLIREYKSETVMKAEMQRLAKKSWTASQVQVVDERGNVGRAAVGAAIGSVVTLGLGTLVGGGLGALSKKHRIRVTYTRTPQTPEPPDTGASETAEA